MKQRSKNLHTLYAQRALFNPVRERINQIRACQVLIDEERAEEARQAQETSVSELSEIELSPEMVRCLSSPAKEGKSALNLSNSSSFLNTTQDSQLEENSNKIALNLSD